MLLECNNPKNGIYLFIKMIKLISIITIRGDNNTNSKLITSKPKFDCTNGSGTSFDPSVQVLDFSEKFTYF